MKTSSFIGISSAHSHEDDQAETKSSVKHSSFVGKATVHSDEDESESIVTNTHPMGAPVTHSSLIEQPAVQSQDNQANSESFVTQSSLVEKPSAHSDAINKDDSEILV